MRTFLILLGVIFLIPFLWLVIHFATLDIRKNGIALRMMKQICLEQSSLCITEWYWGGGGAAGWSDMRVFLSQKTTNTETFKQTNPIAIFKDGCSSLQWSPQQEAIIKICSLKLKTYPEILEKKYKIAVPKTCNIDKLEGAYSRNWYMPGTFKEACNSML